MTRWLEAAREAPTPTDKTDLTDKTPAFAIREGATHNSRAVKSVLSVLSGRGIKGGAPLQWEAMPDDPETYLAFLRAHGPATYGAMSVDLGWGATRAWQAEARLRAAGLVIINKSGKAEAVDANAAMTAPAPSAPF